PVWRLGIRGFTSQPDYKYRLARYDTTFKILKKHLFLGVGLDNYRYVFDEYHQEKFIPDYWKVPDNMFLSILGETGIFGFFSFILFMIMLLKKGFLFFNSNLKNENTEISFILVLAIMGILFSMMTYDLFYWTVPFYMFWIYCGMLSSITIEPDKRYA
ncbi:MAG: O-antigen ligase family protein, partial [Candidatus Staskawiczbacteria bacterium]|nr:O-antigen ligase family protein [Candidatus Staskawiczbacteria bacterium]